MFCLRPKTSDTDELKALVRMAVTFLADFENTLDTDPHILKLEAAYLKARLERKLAHLARKG